MATISDTAVQKCIDFLRLAIGNFDSVNFAVGFWEGTTWQVAPDKPEAFRLVLKHPSALRRMLWPPTELTICEAYFFDDFDIHGDLDAVFDASEGIAKTKRRFTDLVQLGRLYLQLPAGKRRRAAKYRARVIGNRHSKSRDKDAVSFHYDVSNEFYRLWLGEQMVYSGAYFGEPEEQLEKAQLNKLDYICRKLRLKPGERLLDIGCGWGALVIHAARHYDVEAYGVTLSSAQATLANTRIESMNLTGRCSVEVRDYRDIPAEEAFDKIASVEMLHHVGERDLPSYFDRLGKLLRPGGTVFCLGIVTGIGVTRHRNPKFSERYFMPDYRVVPLSSLLKCAEQKGFEIHDIEGLREHYTLTARHWQNRIESAHAQIVVASDEVTYRVWRLSMALLSYAFRTAKLGLFHFVLTRPVENGTVVPLTRADWYDNARWPDFPMISK